MVSTAGQILENVTPEGLKCTSKLTGSMVSVMCTESPRFNRIPLASVASPCLGIANRRNEPPSDAPAAA